MSCSFMVATLVRNTRVYPMTSYVQRVSKAESKEEVGAIATEYDSLGVFQERYPRVARAGRSSATKGHNPRRHVGVLRLLVLCES
jgi:hypothetical protein